MNECMNVWHAHVLLLLLNVTIALYGMEQDNMELEQKTELVKNASDETIIYDYLFSLEHFGRFLKVERAYTIPLDTSSEDFIKNFSKSDVIRTSLNLVKRFDSTPGIICAIAPGKDFITANSKTKLITLKNRYIQHNDISADCCSLAYTPEGMGAAGFSDGSVIMFNEDKTFTASQRHRAAVTSIACVPSQHIYVVGGGNTMRIIKLDTAQTIKDGDVVKMDSKRHSFDNDADIVAIAGPFIVMQPKEGDPFIQSFYSFSAYKAITDGTFSERQKTFLVNWINAKNYGRTMGISDKDYKVFSTLCPTIRGVLQSDFYPKSRTIDSLTHHYNFKMIPEEKS